MNSEDRNYDDTATTLAHQLQINKQIGIDMLKMVISYINYNHQY